MCVYVNIYSVLGAGWGYGYLTSFIYVLTLLDRMRCRMLLCFVSSTADTCKLLIERTLQYSPSNLLESS